MYQDLKSKLALYMSNQVKKEVEPPKPETVSTTEMEGVECFYKDTPYFVIENKYPLSYFHGGFRLGEVLELDMQHLLKISSDPQKELRVQDFVFLDTETTGLSGGAGTVAFLIGVGFFDENFFTLRQYFMRDYDEEPAVLGSLCNLLSERGVMVTFNGRSFDWNLLKTRFTCNRIRPAFNEPVHLDLLYPARSIWKLKLQSCRLSSLEENILGETRIDDIPGYMIPDVYFKYLEDRDTTEVRKVIRHNELDILSMVSLMLKINFLLKDPLAETEDEKELLGVGRLFENKGDRENGMRCYDACTGSENSAIKGTASKRLADLYKKNGDHGKAADLFEKILEDSKTVNIPAMIELAKYYEHREKNPSKALEMVEGAFNACITMGLRKSSYFLDLKKRSERLKRKLANQK